jgi:hypothetical protein
VGVEAERFDALMLVPPLGRWYRVSGDGCPGLRGWRNVRATEDERGDLWQVQPWVPALAPSDALYHPARSSEHLILDALALDVGFDPFDAMAVGRVDWLAEAIVARHSDIAEVDYR